MLLVLLQAVLPVYQGNVFLLASSVCMPNQEAELTNFLVKQAGEFASPLSPASPVLTSL